MAVNRTDLAGDVEPRDRSFHRVEHALLHVVFRAALGVVDDGPPFHDVVRRILDRHHGLRRPLVVFVLAFVAEFVPALNGGSQHFRIHIDLRGDVFE